LNPPKLQKRPIPELTDCRTRLDDPRDARGVAALLGTLHHAENDDEEEDADDEAGENSSEFLGLRVKHCGDVGIDDLERSGGVSSVAGEDLIEEEVVRFVGGRGGV
jgi:hypothetical protein